jgi:hypothetical protein
MTNPRVFIIIILESSLTLILVFKVLVRLLRSLALRVRDLIREDPTLNIS